MRKVFIQTVRIISKLATIDVYFSLANMMYTKTFVHSIRMGSLQKKSITIAPSSIKFYAYFLNASD